MKAVLELENVVEVGELCKKYGAFSALDGCNLTIRKGTIFGLLGPNGAGKTTLIRCLLGFIRPTSGQAHIEGLDCCTESVLIRNRVAYLPAEARLFRTMRGNSVLEFFSQIHPGGSIHRSRMIAERLSLDLSRRVAFMSTGMRQKLAITCVLACRSSLLILDEPTANLDPTVRMEILTLIRDAQREGSTVLFSSHILSEIEDLCNSAAIMRNGRVIHSLDIQELRSTHRISAIPKAAIHFSESDFKDVTIVEQSEHRLILEIAGSLEKRLEWLATLPIKDLRIEPTGLKSVYNSCCEFS